MKFHYSVNYKSSNAESSLTIELFHLPAAGCILVTLSEESSPEDFKAAPRIMQLSRGNETFLSQSRREVERAREIL